MASQLSPHIQVMYMYMHVYILNETVIYMYIQLQWARKTFMKSKALVNVYAHVQCNTDQYTNVRVHVLHVFTCNIMCLAKYTKELK